MGHHETKQPRSTTRADRARLAKETINKTIPALLLSYPLASVGVAGSQLLRDLPPACSLQPSKPDIRVSDSDTLDAAQALYLSHPTDHIAVLSMASPLRPGGGVLTGATSQEESLCMRSTLLPFCGTSSIVCRRRLSSSHRTFSSFELRILYHWQKVTGFS